MTNNERNNFSYEELAKAKTLWEKRSAMDIDQWSKEGYEEYADMVTCRKLVVDGLRKLQTQESADEIKGITHFFSETGTEGGLWSIQDIRSVSEDGEKWAYEGLHILKDNDHLTILNPLNMSEKIWSGIVNLKQYGVFKEDAFGLWIHADQIGVAREQWARWFLDEYPAILKKHKP